MPGYLESLCTIVITEGYGRKQKTDEVQALLFPQNPSGVETPSLWKMGEGKTQTGASAGVKAKEIAAKVKQK